MEITSIDKFYTAVFQANKEYVKEAWREWQKYLADTLKAEVEKRYPDGFKDFLIEKLDADIKTNTKNVK